MHTQQAYRLSVTFNSFDVGVQQGQYLIDAYAGQTDVPLYLYSGATTDNNAFIFFAGAWSVLSDAVANGQFTVANCDAIAPYIGQTLDVTADHEALADILGTITTNWEFLLTIPLRATLLSSLLTTVLQELSQTHSALTQASHLS